METQDFSFSDNIKKANLTYCMVIIFIDNNVVISYYVAHLDIISIIGINEKRR